MLPVSDDVIFGHLAGKHTVTRLAVEGNRR
jgi:hypothetical protein